MKSKSSGNKGGIEEPRGFAETLPAAEALREPAHACAKHLRLGVLTSVVSSGPSVADSWGVTCPTQCEDSAADMPSEDANGTAATGYEVLDDS